MKRGIWRRGPGDTTDDPIEREIRMELATAIAPRRSELQLLLAQSLEKRPQAAQAIRLFEEVVDSGPGPLACVASLHLASLASKRDDDTEAERRFGYVLENADDKTLKMAAALNLATHRVVHGRIAEGAAAIQAFLEVDDGNTTYNTPLTWLLTQFEAADLVTATEQIYRRFLRDPERASRAVWGLSQIYARRGDLEELTLLADWALTSSEADIRDRGTFARSLVLTARHELAEAEPLLVEVLASGPADLRAPALNGLGALKMEAGDFAGAKEIFGQLLVEPGLLREHALVGLGVALVQLGECDEARTLLLEAAQATDAFVQSMAREALEELDS